MERVLIVNADDFGQSAAITRGILRAHEQGIVTSTSLMVRCPAAAYAVELSGGLDLGLHIDLGEWTYCNGEWVAIYERVEMHDRSAIECEIDDQLAEFRRLTGKIPSHLDSHQHVHLHEPILTVARRFAEELGVPLRGLSPLIRYCGEFYGQSGRGDPCPHAITVDALVKLVRDLPVGITELACHPGEDSGHNELSTYRTERLLEVETLCHPRVRDAITQERVRLCSFGEALNDSANVVCSTSK
jgi:chitin disaccharide deacetylase